MHIPPQEGELSGYSSVAATPQGTWLVNSGHAHLGAAVATALAPRQPASEGLADSLLSRGRRRARFLVTRGVAALPGPARRRLVRRRHLGHVVVNQAHLTDPAYLGSAPPDSCTWITSGGLPPEPPSGMALQPMSPQDALLAQEWLNAGPYDSDELLNRRMDNHGDELGRTMAALRLRLRLHSRPSLPSPATGPCVLFDARSLQTAAFGTRGIGRFALSALQATREAVGDESLVLLVDRALEELTPEIAGDCRQVVRVGVREVADYSILVQPSPMTSSPAPLVPLLHSSAHKIAIVFDFIPAHYPTIYLRHPAARTEYAAGLDALSTYDEFICISQVTETECRSWLTERGVDTEFISTSVAWPTSISTGATPRRERSFTRAPGGGGNHDGAIIVMTGDEPRKNTFGALAAIGVATAGVDDTRNIRVIGMAGHDVRVHHWAIAAALRPGETVTESRLTDEAMREVLGSASLVVIASFDEGLSLPVIEALNEGVPVVASDIPAHRELVGVGSHLANPADISEFAQAIRKHRGQRSTARVQRATLQSHRHEVLEDVLTSSITKHRRLRPTEDQTTVAVVDSPAQTQRRLNIGVATPWYPQQTGVADFSVATISELARIADVTVYTTSAVDVIPGLTHRYLEDLRAHPHDHDLVLSVVGNSHFHLPFIELLGETDAVAIAHDTRMVEYYMALRSKSGAEQVMLRGQGNRTLQPTLDEQIDDMRLLQNAGLWEIAHQAKALILHSPTAAPRIAHETGIQPFVLPFANQRVPDTPTITPGMRADARTRLAFDDDAIHVASFGYVDFRTKLSDVVVEAAAWLTQWGFPIALHFVGSASAAQERALTRRAALAGISRFTVSGFVDEATFRDYLLAVDLGVQLRISPLLGVSGPLSDLAAFGTPAVASRGLALDVGTPDYVLRLPDDVSSLLVAEAIERLIHNPMDTVLREQQRVDYLVGKDPALYAEQLLELARKWVSA